MTTSMKLACLAMVLSLGGIGCGRTNLDEGFEIVNTMTGTAGSGAIGGVPSGVGGDPGITGIGGNTGAGGNPGSGGGSTGVGGGNPTGGGGNTGAGGGGNTGVGGGGNTGAGGGGNTGAGGGGNTGAGGGGNTGAGGGGNTGAGGGGSGGKGGGSGGTGGTPGIPGTIPCGSTICKAGVQACCIQFAANPPESCISARERCEGGARIACVDGSTCTQGRVCCLTLLGFDSGCVEPKQCLGGPNIILCTADSQCPGARPNCCHNGAFGTCQARSCNGRRR